eukprot:4195996-Pyramimonas_sp.AAC.1
MSGTCIAACCFHYGIPRLNSSVLLRLKNHPHCNSVLYASPWVEVFCLRKDAASCLCTQLTKLYEGCFTDEAEKPVGKYRRPTGPSGLHIHIIRARNGDCGCHRNDFLRLHAVGYPRLSYVTLVVTRGSN